MRERQYLEPPALFATHQVVPGLKWPRVRGKTMLIQRQRCLQIFVLGCRKDSVHLIIVFPFRRIPEGSAALSATPPGSHHGRMKTSVTFNSDILKQPVADEVRDAPFLLSSVSQLGGQDNAAFTKFDVLLFTVDFAITLWMLTSSDVTMLLHVFEKYCWLSSCVRYEDSLSCRAFIARLLRHLTALSSA